MDRKEFLALALSPLLVPLCFSRPLTGSFEVFDMKHVSHKPVGTDATYYYPDYGYTHKILELTVREEKAIILRKQVEQRADYFDIDKGKKLLKNWAREYHPELKINYA